MFPITRLLTDEQELNVSSSIDVMNGLIVIFSSDEQFANDSFPMLFTVTGITNSLIDEHP